ncbi:MULTISPECIES: STAS domain-containing protein [Streptomyces]|uniref:STAS domain-containing protein n=2 Tax=Streptomyces TaxID=1883 RepID=A0ABW9IXT8_STRGJ
MCLALAGDLDYDTCGDVLDQVRQALLDRDDVENLRLNCRELAVVDSMGLSTLLQIHRSARADGIRFHLDDVGPAQSARGHRHLRVPDRPVSRVIRQARDGRSRA